MQLWVSYYYILAYFYKSHLIEEYDARKQYGVLMSYFEDVFIRMSWKNG